MRREIEKAIEYFAIFGGYERYCDPSLTLQENLAKLLQRYDEIATDFSCNDEHLLYAFATGDRKIDNTIKKRYTNDVIGYKSLQSLIQSDLLEPIHSREKLPPKTHPKQKRKKELRRYRIQNKVRFTKPFHRFWYRYIYPARELITAKKYDEVMNYILQDLDNFVSLTFEELSNELLKEHFPEALSSGSYWDRKVEIDLLLELPDGEVVVGECKWKNSKICKKTLTSLQKKAAIAGFAPRYYALFSKSSFSNELLKNREPNILLFDLEDFKEWSEEEAYKKAEKKPYSFEF